MALKESNALKKLMERYPEVQLATLVDAPPEGSGWVHEVKFDGYRLLAFLCRGEVRLRTRNGKDWTARFPTLAAAVAKLRASDAVLDMEAVILDAEGRSSFQSLQAALGEGGDARRIAAGVFDLLYLNGEDVTGLALTERKERLRKLLRASPVKGYLRYSDHVTGQGAEMFAKACETGLEGIIAKEADAPYRPGRQRSWLKVKCARRQEFVIAGYSDARTGDRAVGALYLGYRKDGELTYAGKVGTGFTMQSARDLVKRFAKLAAAKSVFTRTQMRGMTAGEWSAAHWLRPNLLCEVAFTEWTEDGRIRHPSFQGLREDKSAKDVKQERPMRTTTKAKSASVTVGGIAITHANRVISETGHITKGDLAEYYAGIAPLLLPRIARRPLSLLRCPSGIDGQCFFQRNPGRGLGSNVLTFDFRHNDKKFEYLFVDDEKGLLELIQMGAIELHPWGATVDAIDFPERMIFDLDPAPDVPFEAVKLAAEDLRQRLRDKGREALLKVSGGKGLHVIVPLDGRERWPEVKDFAAGVAREMASDAPDAYIATMSKAKRTGKIFIDYLRNDYTATSIADYGVRARPGAPVALPIEWKELKRLKAANQFTMQDALERVGRRSRARSS